MIRDGHAFSRSTGAIGRPRLQWGVIGCLLGAVPAAVAGHRPAPGAARVKLPGYDEIVELLFIWMTFLGAVALWREGALYRVGCLVDRLLPPPARQGVAPRHTAC